MSLSELVSELETSPRSLYRDLNDLELRGIPIERVEGTYRVSSDASLRPIPLTDRERLVLTLALENAALAKQGPFAKSFRTLKDKLKNAHALPETVVSFTGPERSGAIDERTIEALESAIRVRHSISILYDSLTGGRKRWRGIDPWLVIHRCDAWYVVGRCHTHDEPRVFRLDRIGGVLPIGSTFDKPEFDPDEFFVTSWGVAATRERHDVVIHFSKAVAPLIVNAQHHPGESKHVIDDGGVEYRVRIGHLEELARWVCGFGGDAEVVAPAQLAQLVYSIAIGAANVHRRTQAALTFRATPSRPRATKARTSD